jgi:hypothetical protein
MRVTTIAESERAEGGTYAFQTLIRYQKPNFACYKLHLNCLTNCCCCRKAIAEIRHIANRRVNAASALVWKKSGRRRSSRSRTGCTQGAGCETAGDAVFAGQIGADRQQAKCLTVRQKTPSLLSLSPTQRESDCGENGADAFPSPLPKTPAITQVADARRKERRITPWAGQRHTLASDSMSTAR